MSALTKLRESMQQHDVPAVLLSSPESIAWVSGFSGSFGRAIITPTEAVLVTDSRYTLQAAEQAPEFEVRWFGSPTNGDDFLAATVADLGVESLGFDSGHVTHSLWQKWTEKLKVALQPVPDFVAQLRMVKTDAEIDKVRQACGIADAAFSHIVKIIRPGISEIDVAIELEFFIRRQGATVAFDTIAVSGERSARPHGTPSEKLLEDGDFLTMDYGACVDGYNSDITRTVVVGSATERHREVYHLVLEAQLTAIAMMAPGVEAKAVDAASRAVLDTQGLAQYFGHGLGHGLGRLVHDSGRMASTSTDILREGQVWTVEPGVYIPGFGGVRIEDDVLITASGTDVLTHSTKDLLELPRD